MNSDNYTKLLHRMKKFWRPGDEIICTRIFRWSNNNCYLCDHTPIDWHHVLLNTISDETIDVELSCVIKMKKIIENLGSDQKILFFPKYAKEANHLNSQYVGTASILEFSANAQAIALMLSKPKDLNYQQIRLILDYTSKYERGLEFDLFSIALDIYIERKYFIYDGLEDHQKTGNVESAITNYFHEEWERVQTEEVEHQESLFDSSYDTKE